MDDLSYIKLTPAQRKVIDAIAEHGYIAENSVKRNVRDVLWRWCLIDFESVSIVARIDPNRMTMGRINIDAYVLTDKGRRWLTDTRTAAAQGGE